MNELHLQNKFIMPFFTDKVNGSVRVSDEIIGLCKSIANDYDKGFSESKDDKACIFYGYKFYCRKWEE